MLTVHCRTRAEGYQEAVDWGRIARAVAKIFWPAKRKFRRACCVVRSSMPKC